MNKSILIIQPFRKPSLREVLVKNYPCWEIINTSPLVMASVLEKANMNVNFLSLQNIFKSYENKQENELHDLLRMYIPDVVIFHTDYYISFTSTAVFYSIKMISKFYKDINKNIKVILVGRNGLALGKKVFDIDPNIDIVIKGECENTIVDVINRLDAYNLHDIPGIIYKIDDKIEENYGICEVNDYDELPVPAFHLLTDAGKLSEKYTGLKMTMLPVSIRTSFGCPMNCNYCGGVSTWNKYHIKSKTALENEIIYFKKVLSDKARLMFFADELFTYDKKHVKNVLDIFQKYNLKIDGLFAHSHCFDDDIAEDISKITNCVSFGGENCCDEVLKTSNKNQTFESLLKAINIAKKHGLEVSLEWIVGLPGEDVNTAFENISKLYKLIITEQVDNINTYIFCPYPNTVFSNNANEYGVIMVDDLDEMIEEGYPTYALSSLSRNQIFTYYLFTQLVIKQALLDKELFHGKFKPLEANIDRFKEIFEKVRM